MGKYVFIETRDPFESRDTRFVTETAIALRERRDDVTVFLVQNGVLGVRANARGSHLPELAKSGIRLLADDFSLGERGIQAAEIGDGIQVSSIDALVDMLVHADTKVIWH